MDEKILNKLKALSRDDDSFDELRELYENLSDKKNYIERDLDLIERAIENDYDSIMITGLNLEKPGPKIIYVNKGFSKITGYERDEVIGKTPRILQGPKTDRAVLDRLKKRLRAGRAFFGQTVNYRKDGSEFINQWDIHPLTDKDGNLTHWVSYQHDITERKQAERKVVDTHAEFDDLRQGSTSTLLDVNTDGNIAHANKSFRNLTGYVKDELVGRKVWDLFPKKYRNSLKTRFKKSFNPDDFEGQCLKGIIKHKKGFPIQIEGSSSVLNLKDRTLIRAEIKNITLQKRIMQTLQKRNDDYGKIVDKATQFTYRLRLEDDQPVIEYVSDDFGRVTGLSRDAMIKSGDWQKLVHPDDWKLVCEHLQRAYEGKSQTCEYRIYMRNGSYKKVLDYMKHGTCKEDGESDCVRGSVSFAAEKELA